MSSPRDALLRDPPGGETGSLLAFPLAPARPIDNLPLELSSFVGRERELAQVKRLLSDRRLLTLRGPGGSGKTRLALAAAQDVVEEFQDGVWWVELAPLSDPELVPRAAASALGVREAPRPFADRRSRGSSEEPEDDAPDPGQLRAPRRGVRRAGGFAAEGLP